MTDTAQPITPDRTWSTALAVEGFPQAITRQDWSGSVPVDPAWRAVLRAEQPGTIATEADDALRLSWPGSAGLVHLFTFLPLPTSVAGDALRVRVVLTADSAADLMRVLIAIVFQHRRGDNYVNTLSLRDFRIARADAGVQAVAEGVIDHVPDGTDHLKLLFRLNPASAEIVIRGVEVAVRTVAIDEGVTEPASAVDPAPVAQPTADQPALVAPMVAQSHALPRLLHTVSMPAPATDDGVRAQIGALQDEVGRLAVLVATRLSAEDRDVAIERMTRELAELTRHHQQVQQHLTRELDVLSAENAALRRELDHLRHTR